MFIGDVHEQYQMNFWKKSKPSDKQILWKARWSFPAPLQHLASAYAVEFNAKKNPLRKDADSLATKIAFDKEQTYRPDKITGDWLRVKWGTETSLKRGWIKWKDEAGNLLVNIFYEEWVNAPLASARRWTIKKIKNSHSLFLSSGLFYGTWPGYKR